MTCKEIEGVARKLNFQIINLDEVFNEIPELRDKPHADCLLVRHDKNIGIIVEISKYADRRELDQVLITYEYLKEFNILNIDRKRK